MSPAGASRLMRGTCFSALQRAENSSIWKQLRTIITALPFQCSSASRKFLNRFPLTCCLPVEWFQCSSASRKFLNATRETSDAGDGAVSVLFSEPKIPQFQSLQQVQRGQRRFSALQRAENSSNNAEECVSVSHQVFQCSSASRKFLNCQWRKMNSPSSEFQCSSASRKFLNVVRV